MDSLKVTNNDKHNEKSSPRSSLSMNSTVKVDTSKNIEPVTQTQEDLQFLNKQHEFSVASTVQRRPWVRCGCPTDWNRMFQELLELDDSTEDLCLTKYKKLSALSADFVHTAKNFGKIIIAESKLPTSHQTLSPHPSIGGEEGGEKYVYHGILFKFAVDWKGIYGSDENAMKAADHELKGVMRYAQCEGLHVPLVAIIDYRGYRLVAESILPFRGKSLHYGSNDGGNTVIKSNEKLSLLMKKAGEQLNVKGHFGGRNENSREFIYGPTDIEGHIGTDKRFYVIDFARVFPPTAEKDVAKSFLYKLFRPEFIKSYKIPLSSDGFSKFGKHNAKEHNTEIVEATKYLLEIMIPKFAKEELINLFPIGSSSSSGCSNDSLIDNNNYIEIQNITEIVHRAGINVRYLGLIRNYTSDYLKPCILNEICSRAIKNKLRKLLRKKSNGLTHPQEDLFRQAAINFLNIILGHDTDNVSASNFWKKSIKKKILKGFGENALTNEEKNQDFDLRKNINIYLLFKRVQQLTGVGLTKQAQRDLKNNPESFRIVQSDINKVAAKVKHMNIISLAEAKALAITSMKGDLGSERLFRLACSKFEIAIQATPDSILSLNTYADFLVEYASKNIRINNDNNNNNSNSSNSNNNNIRLFNLAFEKYKTTKNYLKIYELTNILQNIPYNTEERDELILKCYESICEGISDKLNPLWSKSILSWGNCLVLQAKRTNNIELYEEAGKKYRLSFLEPSILDKSLQNIYKLSNDLSNIDLSILFEIYRCSKKFICFDSNWVFKQRLISSQLLNIIVKTFNVKRLLLSKCDHLTSSQLTTIFRNSSNLLEEIDLSYCGLVDDICLKKINDYFSTSLLNLNISECKKITGNRICSSFKM